MASSQRAADAATIRASIAALPPATRKHLKALQAAIRAGAPDGEDSWSYGMPALRLDGRPLLGYAAWKEHVSIYPFGPLSLERLRLDPAKYETSKGTLRLPLGTSVPVTLVKRVVKARVADLRRKAKGTR